LLDQSVELGIIRTYDDAYLVAIFITCKLNPQLVKLLNSARDNFAMFSHVRQITLVFSLLFLLLLRFGQTAIGTQIT
jgi:hypothetical protein